MAKNANMIEFFNDFDHISKLQLVIPSWHAFFTIQGKFQTNMTLATLTRKINKKQHQDFQHFMKEKVQNLCLPKFEGSPTRIIKTIIQIKVEEFSYKLPSSNTIPI